MGPKSLQELLEQAEGLKEQLWYFMDVNKVVNENLKEAMNGLLDLMDDLRPE